MGGKDRNYQVIYRGWVLERFTPGEWVFFERPKENGGGYWMGRTYDDSFGLNSKGLYRYLMALPTCSFSPGLKVVATYSTITFTIGLRGVF